MKAAQPIAVPRVLGVGVLLLVLAVLVPVVVVGRRHSGPVLRTVTVGFRPGMVAVDARTNRAFVTNSTDHTVSALDAASGTVVRTVALPGEADLVVADAHRTGLRPR
jgi:hypothetical protein